MTSSESRAVPVLVWGGGSGGVAAALQAARSGVETVLLTPGAWLGGMLSAAGVCAPDGNELSPWQTGLWGALLRALARAEPTGLDHNWVSCFGFRPATAEAVLRQWVAAEPRLQWRPHCTLLELQRRGERITELLVGEAGGVVAYAPTLVIDGSDLGDLLGRGAGAFRLGWEAREQWQEPSAPPAERLQRESFFSEQPVQSPTWVVMAQLQPQGAASDRPAADLPAPFAGATRAFGLERTLTYGRLPGDLLMLNWPLQGNDWHHGLAALFSGTPAQQRQHLALLAPQMQNHSLTFAAALAEASDGRIRLASVFPAAEERCGSLEGPSPLALMPYWREGRRLLGVETVVEQQLLPLGPGAQRGPLPFAHGVCSSVAVGNYANDHHYPGGDWPLAPKSCRWGGRWSGTPFCIPYGALVSAETSNLLAADKCLSVSHMANGATRLQPLVLNLGQAAGQAAALCLQRGIQPAELPVPLLQRALIEDIHAPAGPFPLWDTPWHHPAWRQRQLAALAAPEQISPDGTLESAAALLDPCQSPPEPHEQLFAGVFHADATGGYQLDVEGRRWPLITLEPTLHQHLAALRSGSRLQVIGCSNPWGPWLRLNRLA
jgi:hypothetical protein